MTQIRTRRTLLLCIVFLILTIPVVAQEFTASVDKNKVTVGEQIELTLTLNGSGAQNLRMPPLNDFNILSGPNQSTNWQFINGQTSSSVTYSYDLQPRTAGKFTIGAASIDVNGKTLQTQPITIPTSETG